MVATLEITLVQSPLLQHTLCNTMLLCELLLTDGTLLLGLLIGARRHGLALVVTPSGHVLLAIPQGLGLRGALLCDLLLALALLVELASTHILGVFHLLLASRLRLLGDLLSLGGLLRGDALHDRLALFGTTVDGFPTLRGSLLCTLCGFTAHGGLLARLRGLGRCGTLLASVGLRLCLCILLLTAVLLVVIPRLLLCAGCCNGTHGQDGADHGGQDVSTCGIQVHGDPRSSHDRRLLPRDALHDRAT